MRADECTGTIAASYAVVPALELAVQQGPLLLQRRRAFGMVEPVVPFSPRERRWRGAFEIGARYSHLDLDAGGIGGGRDHAVSLGLNWYWNRHVRVMADYGLTIVGGDRPDGTLQVFQSSGAARLLTPVRLSPEARVARNRGAHLPTTAPTLFRGENEPGPSFLLTRGPAPKPGWVGPWEW